MMYMLSMWATVAPSAGNIGKKVKETERPEPAPVKEPLVEPVKEPVPVP
jgi:hypothetical protein